MAPRNLHPYEIKRRREWVLSRFHGRFLRLGGWFAVGGILAQLLFVPYWNTEISAVPMLGAELYGISVLAVVVGLAVVLLQVFCTHETHHHEVFASPAEITRIRAGFPVIATTLALTLTLPAVASSTEYPVLALPYTAVYGALGGLSVALGIEYVSKIAWDYTKPTVPSFTRLAVAVLVALGSASFLGSSLLGPADSLVERAGVMIAGVAAGAVVWLWFVHHYELWQRRESDEREYNHSDSRAYAVFRESSLLSVFAGLVVGSGLPIVFGVQRLARSGVSPERATVGLVYSHGVVHSVLYLLTVVTAMLVVCGGGYLLGKALLSDPG